MLRAKLKQHVLDLCERHDIVIEWRRDHRGGWAATDLWLVSIPPIKSPITYAIALHEIGHVLGRHQRSRSRLVRERWAWAWAKRNALDWTPAMARTMDRSLEWYVRRAHRSPLSDRINDVEILTPAARRARLMGFVRICQLTMDRAYPASRPMVAW
jgi:hypothetical protein